MNRSTASEMNDEAFRGAISPLAMLLAGHITRDLFGKCIGWREFEFVFNELNARDEETELAVQVQLLQAGVLTVNEVRAMRGLGPLGPGWSCATGGRSGSNTGGSGFKPELLIWFLTTASYLPLFREKREKDGNAMFITFWAGSIASRL